MPRFPARAGRCLLLSLLVAQSAWSADTPPEPVFPIKRFAVAGNSLIPEREVEERLATHAGEGRRFADVEAARQALLALFVARGYHTVQVVLPEQEVSAGVVRLEVVEARLGNVRLIGALHHDAANVRASVPALLEGATPNTAEIADSLRLANENPSKQTHLLYRPGVRAGEIDAVLRVQDERPWKAYLALDNTGSDGTGDARLALGFQHSNLANRDHVLTLQYVTSPTHVDDVTILGAGYRIPLYASGDALDFYGGYSDVDSGTVEGLFNISGRGRILGGRYTHHFHKVSPLEHKISASLDYRAYLNDIDYLGTPIGADVTVHPVSLTYSGEWTGRGRRTGYYLAVLRNLPGGDSGGEADFAAARAGAEADYALARLGASHTHDIGVDWQLRLALDAQYTGVPLVPGEQFGLGGHDSVRGFGERAVSGDRGWRASLELFGPDLGNRVGLPDARLRLSAFVEGGQARRLEPQPGESAEAGVASAGLGLRFGLGKTLSARLDYGHVLDGGADRQAGEGRLHASLAYLY